MSSDADSALDSPNLPIEEVISVALEYGASDIHLKAGHAPIFRVDGQLIAFPGLPELNADYLNSQLLALLTDAERRSFQQNLELDAAILFPEKARVRINMYTDIDAIGCAMRIVPLTVPSLRGLGMPDVIERLTHERSGLVLVCGVTGAGKSTTLASMVNEINQRDAVHIYTIEDPIEYVHKPNCAVITQREVGTSTRSFSNALRSALRADPNVLLIGEMRDAETIQSALKAAETGLLVFSTLHTHSATKTIQRILGIFPPQEQEMVKMQLSYALRGIVCQQLLPMVDGGRRAFHEILINTPTVREAIHFGEFDKLAEYMKNGAYDGMCMMDDSMFKAYSDGIIDGKTAHEFALNKEEMARVLRGAILS